MLLSMMSGMDLSAYASNTSGDWEYGICKDGTVAIYSYKGKRSSVTIPSKLGKRKVTVIGFASFKDNANLETIVIPNSVTDIEPQAFKNCKKLKKVNMPDSVKDIGYSSFENCSSLSSITLSKSIKYISSYCFMSCNSLTSVVIPKGLNDICDGAFGFCANLKSIVIPNSVKVIYYSAFEDCKKLTDIYYTGSSKEWKNTEIDKDYNEYFCNAKVHYNYTLVKTVKLSSKKYTYNAKVRKPKVIVKDSNGKKISSANYSVKYAEGRKKVGKYAVRITFKGNYSGAKTLYFTIKPKSTSISKLTAKKKGFNVKWKKRTTQTTGYQIQYSSSSKFAKPKTVTVSKNKTTSKTISKLKAKKKYYVRIRTYKTVKVNGKSTKIYSSWSKAKSVTTKK